MWSAPIDSVADSHIYCCRGSIAWLRTPCVRFAADVTAEPRNTRYRLGRYSLPGRSIPAGALHEVSVLHASSSSVFIWRTPIEIPAPPVAELRDSL